MAPRRSLPCFQRLCRSGQLRPGHFQSAVQKGRFPALECHSSRESAVSCHHDSECGSRAKIYLAQRRIRIRNPQLPSTKQVPDTLPKAQLLASGDMRADVIVIGSGPTGLACTIEAQKAGFKVICIDQGCLVNSLFNYPANMIFFTTPELLEIGDIPFTTANPKPNRLEALEYYRKVAEHYKLDL